MSELLPAPNSASRRRGPRPIRSWRRASRRSSGPTTSATRGSARRWRARRRGRRWAAEAVDERSPAAEHRSGLLPGGTSSSQTIENAHSLCQDMIVARALGVAVLFGRSIVRFRSPGCRASVPPTSRRSGTGSSTAAVRVFGEKGYHSATIADVVRESGLSVGAIYTYFSGKDELIRLSCDQIAAQGSTSSAERLGRPRRPPSGWPSPCASTSRRSTSTRARPGQVTLRPGLGRGGPRARRPRDARRPPRATGRRRARCCCTRASPAASCRPGSMSTPSRAASSRCSTG